MIIFLKMKLPFGQTLCDEHISKVQIKDEKLIYMKYYSIVKLSTMWSSDTLKNDVEELINDKAKDGYEIVTVAFGVNMWWMPTAYITICK